MRGGGPVTPYKGIYAHSLTKETEEIYGLQTDLGKTPEIRNAVTALGLGNILTALYAANAAVAAAYSQRDTSRANQFETRDGDTTASLRKEAVSLVIEIFRRINALNDLEPSTEGQIAAQALEAIVEQRKQVVAKSRKSQKTPDEPENPPAEA